MGARQYTSEKPPLEDLLEAARQAVCTQRDRDERRRAAAVMALDSHGVEALDSALRGCLASVAHEPDARERPLDVNGHAFKCSARGLTIPASFFEYRPPRVPNLPLAPEDPVAPATRNQVRLDAVQQSLALVGLTMRELEHKGCVGDHVVDFRM